MTKTVNLDDELSQVTEYWSPRDVGAVNDTALKVVKLSGEFPKHTHEAEDECFLVLDGRLTIDLPDGPQTIRPGEFLVVPRGVEHRPYCEAPVRILLLEPSSTVQYGDLDASAPVQARAGLGAAP